MGIASVKTRKIFEKLVAERPFDFGPARENPRPERLIPQSAASRAPRAIVELTTSFGTVYAATALM